MEHRSGHNFIIIVWDIVRFTIVAMVMIINCVVIRGIIWFIFGVRVPRVCSWYKRGYVFSDGALSRSIAIVVNRGGIVKINIVEG